MAATDPKSLYASGNCYACAGVSEVDVMELGLLSLIVKTLNPAVDTSPTALNKLINCFMCFAPGSTAQMYRLALLSLIAQNISGSGGGGGGTTPAINGVTCGNYSGGIPTFTPVGSCAFAIDTSDREIWAYFSGAWHDTGIQTA